MPFSEWLTHTRTPSGMDEGEQALARSLEQRSHEVNDAAEAALNQYLHGNKPRKAE